MVRIHNFLIKNQRHQTVVEEMEIKVINEILTISQLTFKKIVTNISKSFLRREARSMSLSVYRPSTRQNQFIKDCLAPVDETSLFYLLCLRTT